MSEISNILTTKEKIFWEGKPNLGRYFIGVSALILAILIFLILGIFASYYYTGNLAIIFYIISALLFIVVVYRILLYNHLAYVITNNRVIIQRGVIGRDYKSIDFDKIQDIGINVGLFDKIFGTGSLDIKTAGVNVVQTRYGSTVVPSQNIIGYVKNPYEVAKILKEKAHLKRGGL